MKHKKFARYWNLKNWNSFSMYRHFPLIKTCIKLMSNPLPPHHSQTNYKTGTLKKWHWVMSYDREMLLGVLGRRQAALQWWITSNSPTWTAIQWLTHHSAKTQRGNKVNYNLESFWNSKLLKSIGSPLAKSTLQELTLQRFRSAADCFLVSIWLPSQTCIIQASPNKATVYCKVKWAQCCMQEITEQLREELFRGLEPKLFI